MSVEFVEKMNALDPESVMLEPVGENGQQAAQQEVRGTEESAETSTIENHPIEEPSEDPVSNEDQVENVDEGDEGMPDLINQDDNDSDDEVEDDSGNQSDDGDGDDGDTSNSATLRHNKIRGAVRKPSCYALVTKKLQDKMIGSEELRRSLDKVKEDKIRSVFEEVQAMGRLEKRIFQRSAKHIICICLWLRNSWWMVGMISVRVGW